MLTRSLIPAVLALAAITAPHESIALSDDHGQRPPNWLAGTIASDSTLHYAVPGPIYIVYGDLIVAQGAALTIEPGVTLQTAAYSDFFGTGQYPDKVEIIVNGTLIALGTSSQRITISSSFSAGDASAGLLIGGSAHIAFTNVSSALNAITVNGSADLSDCEISGCDQSGIVIGGSATLARCLIHGITTGITSHGSLIASHVQIDNAATGVAADGQVALSDIVGTNLGDGFLVGGASGYLRNCVITGRGESGLGLSIGPGVSTTPVNSSSPVPTSISGFWRGVEPTSGASASNLLIYKNLIGVNADTYASFAYSTVTANGIGVRFNFGNSANLVSNCVVASNHDVGIQLNGGTVTYSDVWNNGNNVNGTGVPPFLGPLSMTGYPA